MTVHRRAEQGAWRDEPDVYRDRRSPQGGRPHQDGAWRDEPDVYRDGERFELPGLTRAIAVHEVHDGLLDAAGQSLLR